MADLMSREEATKELWDRPDDPRYRSPYRRALATVDHLYFELERLEAENEKLQSFWDMHFGEERVELKGELTVASSGPGDKLVVVYYSAEEAPDA